MTGPLYAIGRLASRHHWPTIAAWLVLAVGLVVAGQAAEDKTKGEEFFARRDAATAAERS